MDVINIFIRKESQIQAFAFWKTQTAVRKNELALKHYKCSPSTLKGSFIEHIWRMETAAIVENKKSGGTQTSPFGIFS